LTFSLVGAPSGASITAGGAFTVNEVNRPPVLSAVSNQTGIGEMLSVTVKDITAETSDSAYDSLEGDILNSKVTFVDRDTNAPIAGCSNLSVGLVNLVDTKTRTATCNWNVNIGSADSLAYTIGIIVSKYYTRNSSADNSVLTVSKWHF
jgi:hypothetical protein